MLQRRAKDAQCPKVAGGRRCRHQVALPPPGSDTATQQGASRGTGTSLGQSRHVACVGLAVPFGKTWPELPCLRGNVAPALRPPRYALWSPSSSLSQPVWDCRQPEAAHSCAWLNFRDVGGICEQHGEGVGLRGPQPSLVCMPQGPCTSGHVQGKGSGGLPNPSHRGPGGWETDNIFGFWPHLGLAPVDSGFSSGNIVTFSLH